MITVDIKDDRIISNFRTRLKETMQKRNVRAVDICRATNIPHSTISHYLSGRQEAKQKRLYALAKYLRVSEVWLMGYDVPMERSESQIKNDKLVELVERMQTDEGFADVVRMLYDLKPDQYEGVKALLKAFAK